MTLFVDASVLVAMIENEPERHRFEAELEGDPHRLISGLATWEAARAVGRGGRIGEGLLEVTRYCVDLGIRLVPIGEDEAREAVLAHARYGKGTGHPARLNMGDCFAYACAKTHGARLLYKGDDFTHTDMA